MTISLDLIISDIEMGWLFLSIASHSAFESTTNHPLVVKTSDSACELIPGVTNDLKIEPVFLVEYIEIPFLWKLKPSP